MTTDALIGKVVGGCRLVRVLGRGNNGVVYLARHEKLDQDVACKIISPEMQEDSDFLDNLFEEAASAAKVSHPNIIRALDAGNDDSGLKYFTMEYIDGSSLESIRANNPEMISLDFLYDIAIQLSDALGFVWRKHGMIHGDIKPGNLMVCSPGRTLKIGDFGGAKSGDDYDPENVMITPMYVAPEIIRQQNTKPDPRSDIYSFGAMLYELACGTAPFNGTMEEILQAHLDTAPQPLIVMNPDLNRDFAAFIDSMLAKNPDDRPADWDEVKGSLQLLREGKPLKKKEAAAKNPAAPRHASWSAEKKYQRKKKFLEKFPWLIPALLILVILAALATIPFTMGFFK